MSHKTELTEAANRYLAHAATQIGNMDATHHNANLQEDIFAIDSAIEMLQRAKLQPIQQRFINSRRKVG